MITELKKHSLVYVATPYSKYPGGLSLAFEEAARITAYLLQRGVGAFSPIAHTHPIAIYGDINPLDHSFWLPVDLPIINKSDALLVVKMDGWKKSKGIAWEIERFKKAKKPIYYFDPYSISGLLKNERITRKSSPLQPLHPA